MNVEQLRKQAKELVKAARAGDEAAVRAPRRTRADPRASAARNRARAGLFELGKARRRGRI